MPDKSPSTTVYFHHPNPYVGDLTIENGIDEAQWGYNLNTQVYPTYGGEVVQILSVNIGDLQLGGSVTTYRQAQLIYGYFARYFQMATQGKKGTPNVADYQAYDLRYMTFRYPMRNWNITIMPKSAPGFTYDAELVNPVWTMTAHVVDTANEGELSGIANAIQSQAVNTLMASSNNSFNSLTDQISPNSGNPNSDPFQTYNQGAQSASTALGNLSDYYSSLVSGFTNGNYVSITGNQGSRPASNSSKGSKKSTQTVNNQSRGQAGHSNS